MSEQQQYLTYGQVTYKRVISDGDHGNVQVERTLPILLDPDKLTPDAIQEAENVAWAEVIEQVNEHINSLFELEGKPAPLYDGQRYHVGYWRPDETLLLIVPEHASPPGGIRTEYGTRCHRLPAARHIAERLMEQKSYIDDTWDFWDGDFTELQARWDKLLADAADQFPDLDDEEIDYENVKF